MAELTVDNLHLAYGDNLILKGVSMTLDRGEVVSLWGTGAADMVAALSLINVLLVGIGLTVALRFGVRLHE